MPYGRENTWLGESRLKEATGATSSRDALLVMSTPGTTGPAGYSFRPAGQVRLTADWGESAITVSRECGRRDGPGGVSAPRSSRPAPVYRTADGVDGGDVYGQRQPAGRIPAGLTHGLLAIPAGGGQGPARRVAARRAAGAHRHLRPRRGLPGAGRRLRARGGPGARGASGHAGRQRTRRAAGPGRPGGGRAWQPGVPRGRVRGRRHRRGRRPVPAPDGRRPGRGDRPGATARG